MNKHRRIADLYKLLLVLTAILSLMGTGLIYASESQAGPVWQSDLPDSEARTVTVGFSPIPGICTVDAYGNYEGLLVDYLDEIAKYNNWNYEYILVDPNDLLGNFLDDKYDILGGTFYLPGYESKMAYPKYSMGNSKAVLLCRMDDPDIKSYELSTLTGKTIGVYGQATEKLRRLRDFLQLNDLHCGIRTFDKDDMAVDNNLYQFLESGEVDLLLGNESEVGDFRIAAEFPAQPYYIVTHPWNEDILDGLNLGLEKILNSDPKFAEEHYDRNFQGVNISKIRLNAEELDYVEAKRTVTVAVVDDWHPFYCLDSTLDHHSGILPDLLTIISDYSGLEFQYVLTDTYEDAVRLVTERKADMLGYYLDSREYAASDELAISKPYMTLNNIIVKNKSANYPSDGLTAGVLDGRRLPQWIPAAQVRYYGTPREYLSAVNRGEIDFAYGLSAAMEHEMQSHRYLNIVPLSSINNNLEICFAMDRPVNSNLLTILNKAIANMSAEEQNALTDRNMVSMGYTSMTVGELIYANPLAFIAIFSAFVLMAAASILLIMRARLRNSMMQSELEKAEAKSKAKGEFLSRMSHEIRTPMNAIMGLANLTCMEQQLPERVEANLQKILSSSRYLLSLINDILDMSRIENGKMEIQMEVFSLNPILSDLENMMRSQADSKHLVFTVEFEIHHPVVLGDPIRLRQVLANLLSNAIKFTPEGGRVLLTVTETDSGATTAHYLFSVRDNGIGIEPKYQKRIFDSFEQVGSSSAKSAGTGLGLPISSSIVLAMGGELKVNSTPGEGSEFYFSLEMQLSELPEDFETPPGIPAAPAKRSVSAEPSASAKPSAPAEPSVSAEPAEPAGTEPENLAGVRILLAEDNDLNAEIAMELLQMNGAQVERAVNGLEALERFTSSPAGSYHVILMDIRMPVMDGLEATRRIRASGWADSASIPIIAMTANSFKEDSDAAARAGMTGFVSKPVDMAYLLDILKKSIRT